MIAVLGWTVIVVEMVGGVPRAEGRMIAFRECLARIGLCDVGYSGHAYTWSNKQSGRDNIQECLDRGLATESWMEAFPRFRVSHLT
ncbi:hypothetical protein ACS0TY_001124 [Phlomoides rotata]